ncbi:hypothetical protein JXB41_01525 [Candidatus Woesearchaeota archaeon]|nr:hypothetical protein [Candidatus Woesearchaeota archaeon]
MKKAQAFNIMHWSFTRIPFIIGLIIIFYLFFSSQYNFALETHKVGDYIFEKRFLYSPNALAYQDPETKRVYPGIIDMTKFDEDNINKSFVFEKSYIAAKFELTDLETGHVKEIYVNEKWYNRWSSYTSFEQYDQYILKRFVLIKTKDGFTKGFLKMDLVVNNLQGYASKVDL